MVVKQVTQGSEPLLSETKLRREAEARRMEALETEVKSLVAQIRAEVELRKEGDERVEGSFFGAIDSLEKKVADVRVRCSDQVEAALDRVAQMEGSHQQDLSQRDHFERRLTEQFTRMLSSRQEEMQTFQDTISAQFRETKEGVERECRRVSEQFAPLLSKFQVLEETIQKEKAAREAQADEISRLTELIRALQTQQVAERNDRHEQEANLARKSEDSTRKLRMHLDSELEARDSCLTGVQRTLESQIASFRERIEVSLDQLDFFARKQVASLDSRINTLQQEREQAEEQIVSDLGASILSLQKTLQQLQ